jgi:hypothetical protein
MAVRATPIHSRLPSLNPNQRSASTARNTRPPEITAWTSEMGAMASAATCRTHAPRATAKPIVHHLEENRPVALRSGWRMSTSGACVAPLCFHRNARFVVRAQASASRSPSCTVI